MDHAAPSPRPVVRTLPEYRTSATLASAPRFRASSNEHTDPPSEAVIAAVADAARNGNRYPAPYGGDLIDVIADQLGVAPETVAVDGGSHTLLNHLLLAFVGPASRVVYSWRSFEAYPISVAATGGVPVPIPGRADGSHDLEAMLAAIDANTSVVLLCNPNNPTGSAFGMAELVSFVERAPKETLIVVDEAYVDFIDPEAFPGYDSTNLLLDHPNVLVLRTFSKCYALAGFRVGYCLAHPDVVSSIRAVLPTFPVSQPAVAAAKAALADTAHHDQTVSVVSEQRRIVTAALRDAGFPVNDSQANFVWLPLGDRSTEFAEACLAAGIIVRPFASDGVRITVGQPRLAEALLDAVGTLNSKAGIAIS